MRRPLIVVSVFVVLASACSADPAQTTTDTSAPTTVVSSTVASSTSSTATSSTTMRPTTTKGPTSTTVVPTTVTTSTAAPSTTTTTTTVPPDVTAPELVITDPDPEATVATKAYTFRGVTEPDATVIAAGRYGVEVDPDGGWSILLVLNPGWNRATFTATDPAGNTSVAMVRVEYVVPLEEAIVGWWKGPATVPVAWSKIGTVLFEFRADGTYSAHSSSEIAALYWGTDADSPRKTYGFYGPVPGRGHIAIVWPRSSGGTVQYGRIENIIIEGNQLHFELWNDWGRRPPYGPVIYDLTRVSPDALDIGLATTARPSLGSWTAGMGDPESVIYDTRGEYQPVTVHGNVTLRREPIASQANDHLESAPRMIRSNGVTARVSPSALVPNLWDRSHKVRDVNPTRT